MRQRNAAVAVAVVAAAVAAVAVAAVRYLILLLGPVPTCNV
jgi:hypothetical protein